MRLLKLFPHDDELFRVETDEITLEFLQKEIDGYIQPCAPVELKLENIEMLCDEEGLLKHKTPNKNLYPFFFVGSLLFVGVDGEDFVGLTNEQITFIEIWLKELREEFAE